MRSLVLRHSRVEPERQRFGWSAQREPWPSKMRPHSPLGGRRRDWRGRANQATPPPSTWAVRSGNERQGRSERRRGCGVPDRRSASVAATRRGNRPVPPHGSRKASAGSAGGAFPEEPECLRKGWQPATARSSFLSRDSPRRAAARLARSRAPDPAPPRRGSVRAPRGDREGHDQAGCGARATPDRWAS
jgi:hypothetical protein